MKIGLLLIAFFAVAVAGPWAWFHVGTRAPEEMLRFDTRTNIAGYRFRESPVGAKEMEILANTNLFNGNYEGPGGRISAFAAEWEARNREQMGVLGHTPDICWVGAGFTLASLGEPAFLEAEFAGRKIPFECRVFRAPDGRTLEMVAWCSLVSGQVLEEGFRFQPERNDGGNAAQRQYEYGRVRRLNAAFSAIQKRRAGDGTKQFVRFSTPVTGDWRPAYERLRTFATQWLVLEIQRPQA
jgi:hypothetical protein